jgi:hypothetical protein
MTPPGTGTIKHDGHDDWSGLPSIASLTPTVCRLMHIDPPAIATEPPLEQVVDAITRQVDGRRIEKCLIYCPDALGEHVWRRWPEREHKVQQLAPHQARVRSVSPSKTPVCYASIFTGAPPEVHGIRSYERPVLRCDTLFDAFVRAGRPATIAAVADSSIDLIFRDRDLRYLPGRDDGDTHEIALREIANCRADLIVAYHQEYDDMLHETGPFSDECAHAMARHLASFEALVAVARFAWRERDVMVVFAPDHGAHTDPETGRGTHGADIPEDMLVRHWYGAFPAE